ncbi:MAG: hypothetical protein QOF31_3403 [Mycobacterium sp.]|jgi:predicted metal-binding membrane protein|nr:hypothetical protein [Mycobacterium sp.]
MMRIATTLVEPVHDLASAWQQFRWHHPEWTLAVVVIAAWLALFASADKVGGGPTAAIGAHTHHGVQRAGQFGHDPPMAAAHWVLMVVAMMLLTILPAARFISLSGRWERRQRGPALFAIGYLSVWIALGLIAFGVVQWAAPHLQSRWMVAAALGVAAVWELTIWKLRFLRACHRMRPIPPDGWKADCSVVMRGLRNAASCVGACWAMMAPMMFAGHVAAMWLMGPITLAIAMDKFAAKPKKVVRPVAAGLAALAILTTIW